MPVEHQIQPFTSFIPGNHLILGAAGVGKTRLIWSLLQSKEYYGENTINIVLTDSSKHAWHDPSPTTPIIPIDPYSTNMRWIAEPTVPGIYFAACDYLPRVITFLECLANYARSSEGNLQNPVRVFIDFPVKFWRDACFIEQLDRLQYISDSHSENEGQRLDIWMVMTVAKDLPAKVLSPLQKSNLIVLNPASKPWLSEVQNLLGKTFPQLELLLNKDGKSQENGFYYFPYAQQDVLLQEKSF